MYFFPGNIKFLVAHRSLEFFFLNQQKCREWGWWKNREIAAKTMACDNFSNEGKEGGGTVLLSSKFSLGSGK